MTVLSNRGLNVIVGAQKSVSLKVEGPHITTKIKRSLEGQDLDSSEVSIFNPSTQLVDLIMSTKTVVLSEINAWYYSVNSNGILGHTFRGTVEPPLSFNKKGLDHELKFTIVDGLQELSQKEYTASFEPSTLWIQILEDIINKISGPGAAIKYISAGVRAKLQLSVNRSSWSKSCSFVSVLNDICKVHGLKWSVQNGVTRIVLKEDRSQLKFYDLDSQVLIEDIAPSKEGNSDQTLYKCKSFYLADVLPGDYITFFGKKYIILELEHNLSNFSDAFHTSLVLEELS